MIITLIPSRLARDGRLDASDALKLKFIGINGDWDELSDEVTNDSPKMSKNILKLKKLKMFENSYIYTKMSKV
jgi:hypothetical protein